MRDTYIAFNGAAPAAAAGVAVSTGTAVRNMLQIATPSTRGIRLLEWGISMDGSPAAIKWELMQSDAAETGMTAHIAAGVMAFSEPSAATSLVTLGTAATGYTGSTTQAVTPTNVRLFDHQILSTNTYIKQWPLGQEPQVAPSKFLRVRATAAAAVNAICYIVWSE
jgi:hypothetical protein